MYNYIIINDDQQIINHWKRLNKNRKANYFSHYAYLLDELQDEAFLDKYNNEKTVVLCDVMIGSEKVPETEPVKKVIKKLNKAYFFIASGLYEEGEKQPYPDFKGSLGYSVSSFSEVDKKINNILGDSDD